MLLLSLLFLLALVNGQGRQTAVIDNCNYINEMNPDDGTNIGWYAINPTTAIDNCNYNIEYDAQGAESGSISWYYECDTTATPPQVKKYTCSGVTDCSCGAGGATKTYDSNSADVYYQCDPTTYTGECLFKWKSYHNTDENGCATSTPPEVVRQVYGVNGACADTSGNGNDYKLSTCTDSTTPNGFVMEDYGSDSECSEGTCHTWVTIYNDECNEEAFGGQFQAEECTGGIPAVYEPDQVIDGVNGPFTCEVEDDDGNTVEFCQTEIDNCAANTNCEFKADYLLCNFPDCTVTFEGMEDGFINTSDDWCKDSTNCPYLLPFYECIKENKCYTQYASDSSGSGNDGGDNTCDCSTEFGNCANDATCGEAVGIGGTAAIDFDNSEDPFGDINTFCSGKLSDGMTDANCAVLRAVLECQMGCDGGGDGGDSCFDTSTALKDALIDCAFDTNGCYTAFNGILGDILTDDSICDTGGLEACSPGKMESDKTTYCNDQSNTCPAAFDTLWTEFMACLNDECVWNYCTTEIEACLADTECTTEINYVVDIEDVYRVKDDDFMVLAKNRYCAKKDGGCTTLLDTAFSCVEDTTNGKPNCLEISDNECWESECGTEIDACYADGVCFDTLLNIMKSQTECEEAIPETTNYEFCPADCDDLGEESDYSSCGTAAEWDDENNMFEAVPGSSLDEYYMCKGKCEECDDWLDVGQAGCGAGQCGTTFEDLMTCVISKCPDDDEGDGCFSPEITGYEDNGDPVFQPPQCTDKFAACLFRDECYQDWSWMNDYFQSMDGRVTYNEQTQEIEGEPFEFPTQILAMDSQCSLDMWTESSGACFETEYEDVDCQSQVWQCYYYDIVAYCQGAGVGDNANTNGCSAEFWNMLNCFFGCQFNTLAIETQLPTENPTVAPVVAANPSKANMLNIIFGVIIGIFGFCFGW